MEERWIQTKSLYSLLELEPFILLSSLIVLAWFFYKVFLGPVSTERHESIRLQFRNLMRHYLIFIGLYAIFHVVYADLLPEHALVRILPYLALLAFAWGGVVFVRVSRLIILQYLFLGSLRTGVPILIVNIYSLLLAVLLVIWSASQVLALNVGPLIATSAGFSLILGLAMQDTLGNLFAGISLQLDRVFEIGDWLEIQSGMQKTVGQVKEVTWRATTLIGWSDEVIVIPNRSMASSQISNYQNGDIPIIRSQVFRLPYNAPIERVKETLLKSIDRVHDVRKFPEPICFVNETTDSWLSVKLAYYVDRFGSQFLIGDRVVMAGWKALGEIGYAQSASQVMRVETHKASP